MVWTGQADSRKVKWNSEASNVENYRLGARFDETETQSTCELSHSLRNTRKDHFLLPRQIDTGHRHSTCNQAAVPALFLKSSSKGEVRFESAERQPQNDEFERKNGLNGVRRGQNTLEAWTRDK